MTPEVFSDLQVGDVLRHVGDGASFVVVARVGDAVVAQRAITLTNEIEWKKHAVRKALPKEGWLAQLTIGDSVEHRSAGGRIYQVAEVWPGNSRAGVIGICTQIITDPERWLLLVPFEAVPQEGDAAPAANALPATSRKVREILSAFERGPFTY